MSHFMLPQVSNHPSVTSRRLSLLPPSSSRRQSLIAGGLTGMGSRKTSLLNIANVISNSDSQNQPSEVVILLQQLFWFDPKIYIKDALKLPFQWQWHKKTNGHKYEFGICLANISELGFNYLLSRTFLQPPV